MGVRLFLIATILLACACGNSSDDVISEGTDSLRDSIPAYVQGEIDEKLYNKFDELIELPLEPDSNYISSSYAWNTHYLGYKEVRYLSYNRVIGPICSDDFYPDEFCWLDSIGKIVGYKADADSSSNDIRSINAYAGATAMINDSTKILFWLLSNFNLETGMGRDAKVLYGSVLRNNVVTSCTVLCKESEGWTAGSSTREFSVFSMKADGTVRVDTHSESKEDNKNGASLITVTSLARYEITIENDKWAIVEIIEDPDLTFR